MAIYVDCDYCGEGLTPGSREYLRFDAVDPATSRDVRLGAARLHRECAEAVEQLLKDHVAWVRGGGAPLSWQLSERVAEQSAPKQERSRATELPSLAKLRELDRQVRERPSAPPERRRPTTGDETPIHELRLEVRITSALRRVGYTTVGELAASSDKELLATPNFGPLALRQLHEALARRGYSAREESR